MKRGWVEPRRPVESGGSDVDVDLAPAEQRAADSDGTGIVVDLTPLNGSTPTSVRYAWGILQCCDHADPTLYVTHGCVANCPIYSAKAALPANPFKARIVGGKCQCVAPQVC